MSAGALPRLDHLPKLSAGPIQNVQRGKSDWQDGGESLRRLQDLQDPNLVKLGGIDGIRGVQGMPEVATDLLVLHARTLPAEELDTYIVNPKLAAEWVKEHSLTPEFKALVHKAALDDGKRKKKGCSTRHISTGCVKTEVEQSVDDLTRVWQKAWEDTRDELGRALGRIDDIKECFADQTITLSDIPVNFSAEPRIPLSFGDSAKRGGASGNVSGSIAVGVPVNGDFRAQVKIFYIPCLPFVVRPRSIAATGSMAVGGSFTANVLATGEFHQLFTVPPMGGVQIPIAVLPIALGGVPIFILDISIFLDGTLDISGAGTLKGDLKLESMQNSAFAFECSGHNCSLDRREDPLPPATAIESVKLDGWIQIKPAIYAALQLSLNYNVLSVRAGPQPFLLGKIHGCAAASGAQNTAGTSSGEQSYALTADLDWGLELRAEAVAGGKKVAEKKWKLEQDHIYFKDLAQSTALKPGVAGTLQPSLGQPAAYTATMPTCYPYPDEIEYQVKWTGGATATTGAPDPGATKGRAPGLAGNLAVRATSNNAPSTCTLEAEQARCSGAPLALTSLNLTWPTLGDYLLTVTPVGDTHGRRFDSSRATEINVQVQQ